MPPRTDHPSDQIRIFSAYKAIERLLEDLKKRKAPKWTMNRAQRVIAALADLKAAVATEQGA